jgi:hypothetical protein
MKRVEDWVQRLEQVLKETRDKPFNWGTFNCCIFTANCVEAQTGVDFMKDIRTQIKDKKTVTTYLKKHAGGSLIRFVEHIITTLDLKEINSAYVQRGDVVITKNISGCRAMAVVDLSGRSIVLIHPGMGCFNAPLDRIERAWRIS